MENEQMIADAEVETAIEDIAEENSTEAPSAELDRLREEVRKLNERLAEKEAQSERIAAELGAFSENFPNVDIKSVPEDVWESVRAGNSLAASYALYTHRVNREQALMRERNEKNAYRSAGRVGKSTSNEYFTPDEVKKMSASEVKANYTKIIESMKKWN